MPFDPCSPCGCVPANIGDQLFYQMATNLLCSINENISSVTGGGVVRFDAEILCDPGDSRPIVYRYAYQTDGTVLPIAAFELDGTAYAGVIADLVACGGGGSGGDVNIAEVGGVAVTLATLGIHLEDSPTASGDSGVGILLKRQDAPTIQTDTDGDYTLPVGDAYGRQDVILSGNGGGLTAGVIPLHVDALATAPRLNGLPQLPIAYSNQGSFVVAAASTTTVINTTASQVGLVFPGDYVISTNVNSRRWGIVQTVSALAVTLYAETALEAAPAAGNSFSYFHPQVLTLTDPAGSFNAGSLHVMMSTSAINAGLMSSYPLKNTGFAVGVTEAFFGTGNVRTDTPAANFANNSWQYLIGDDFAALYVQPASREAVWEYSSTAFGAIGAAFAVGLTSSAKKKIILLKNKTDVDIEVSFDGVNVHAYVDAGETQTYDLGTNSRWESSNVSIRDTGVAATTGSFKITAMT